MNSTSLSNLSQQDLKLIESLRKQQHRWPRLRWAVLSIALAAAFLAGLFGYIIWTGLTELGGTKAAVTIASLSYISASLAVMALSNLVRLSMHHSIHRTRHLVLKLADVVGSGADNISRDH